MATPVTLIIRHVANSDPPQFMVERFADGKTAPPVVVAPPNSVSVEGRPNARFTDELRWYLETFLDYPFPPDTDHAERVQHALETWGKQTFTTLFTSTHARRSYERAVEHGFANLTIRIVSDSPIILGWPWEALHDPEPGGGRLAHHCAIERRIDTGRDPVPLGALPTDRVNVLLVIARPLEGDVRYRSVSRSLVEFAAAHTFPISVDVLRPPTFDRLREHLKEHPNHYHILHFDGHGAYRADAPPPGGGAIMMRTAEARLLFETDHGSQDPIAASVLSDLLREHAVPVVVLNACQSAMIDERAADPFASVAAAFLKAGMRSVVAMAYALYVSGAQQFLPAFYRTLFESGSLAAAVRAGRQMMLRNPRRACARGTFPLEDWVVPVVYQQDPIDLSFVTKPASGERPAATNSQLPEEALAGRDPYGFVGRDGALLELERAMHRPPAGILITGLGGVGKTALAKGFLRWLDQTNGLGNGAIWFSFVAVRSAEYVFNRLGEFVFGRPEFATLDLAQKAESLASGLHERRVWVVWDNFESVRGIAGTAISPSLSAEDADRLSEFLARLRGGKTKVLITSRSAEDWLGVTNCGKPVALAGLDGEERWEYANAIVRDLGLTVDRTQPEVAKLVDQLRGHPLAMRIIIPMLGSRTAAELATALRDNFDALRLTTSDESDARLFATLKFATDALPKEWGPLLIPLGLHEGFVNQDLFQAMADRTGGRWKPGTIEQFLKALANAGLLQPLGAGDYEMHPALASYLRSTAGDAAAVLEWELEFVKVIAPFADDLTPRPLHEQVRLFELFSATFYAALRIAQKRGMTQYVEALMQSLAAYARNTGRWADSENLFKQLAKVYLQSDQEAKAAAPYHELGTIAHKRWNLVAAEGWYRQSLEISERLRAERMAGITYHQLGMLSQDRLDWDAAERWYRKSLEISERLRNEDTAARTSHQLGVVAHGRGDLDTAEERYRTAAGLFEKNGIVDQLAITYNQLGQLARDRQDFGAAEGWYRKSLEISEPLRYEDTAAMSYHELGMIFHSRGDLAAAEGWYRKSLEIKERMHDERGTSITYHQMGRVCEDQEDYGAAECWFRKSLEIKERLNDEHLAAGTCYQLGRVALARRDYGAAEEWYRRSLEISDRIHDQREAAQSLFGLGMVAQVRSDSAAAEGWYRKSLEIYESINDEQAAAVICHFLGIITHERREFEAAWLLFLKALATCAPERRATIAGNLAQSYRDAPPEVRSRLLELGRNARLPEDFLLRIEQAATQPPLTQS